MRRTAHTPRYRPGGMPFCGRQDRSVCTCPTRGRAHTGAGPTAAGRFPVEAAMPQVVRSRIRALHGPPPVSPLPRRFRSLADREAVAVLHRAARRAAGGAARAHRPAGRGAAGAGARLPRRHGDRTRRDLAGGPPLATAQRRLTDPAPGVPRGRPPHLAVDRREPRRTGRTPGRGHARLPDGRGHGLAGPGRRHGPAPTPRTPGCSSMSPRTSGTSSTSTARWSPRPTGRPSGGSPGAGRTSSA